MVAYVCVNNEWERSDRGVKDHIPQWFDMILRPSFHPFTLFQCLDLEDDILISCRMKKIHVPRVVYTAIYTFKLAHNDFFHGDTWSKSHYWTVTSGPSLWTWKNSRDRSTLAQDPSGLVPYADVAFDVGSGNWAVGRHGTWQPWWAVRPPSPPWWSKPSINGLV